MQWLLDDLLRKESMQWLLQELDDLLQEVRDEGGAAGGSGGLPLLRVWEKLHSRLCEAGKPDPGQLPAL